MRFIKDFFLRAKGLPNHFDITRLIHEDKAGEVLDYYLNKNKEQSEEYLRQISAIICEQQNISMDALYCAYFRRTGEALPLEDFKMKNTDSNVININFKR